jgi:hypothetical protein
LSEGLYPVSNDNNAILNTVEEAKNFIKDYFKENKSLWIG